MAERRELFKVDIISDHSCGTYQIGEIDTWPRDQIYKYIERYEDFGYTEIMEFAATLIELARNARREINESKNNAQSEMKYD